MLVLWILGAVVLALLATAWVVDRRGGSGSTPGRAFSRASSDLGKAEHYRFMRRGG